MASTQQNRQVGRRVRTMREKQSRIFEVAARLFAERGFAAVTTQQISDRADIAAGTLFRYASSKGQLLLMVYNEDFRSALATGARRARAVADPVGAITALLRPILVAAARNPENTIAYQRELLFGPPEETYREQGLALVAQLESVLAEILLTAGADSGEPTAAQREAARVAGRSLFAVLHMALVRPSTGVHPHHDPIDDLHAQIAQLVAGFRSAAATGT